MRTNSLISTLCPCSNTSREFDLVTPPVQNHNTTPSGVIGSSSSLNPDKQEYEGVSNVTNRTTTTKKRKNKKGVFLTLSCPSTPIGMKGEWDNPEEKPTSDRYHSPDLLLLLSNTVYGESEALDHASIKTSPELSQVYPLTLEEILGMVLSRIIGLCILDTRVIRTDGHEDKGAVLVLSSLPVKERLRFKFRPFALGVVAYS
uniref:Uncharacterized protein n=1 Tax=Timema poppense TaxID=170557 RepID=A0A7R9DHS5_TIMPO|nr:unnamed protein product [Timema poppensis]